MLLQLKVQRNNIWRQISAIKAGKTLAAFCCRNKYSQALCYLGRFSILHVSFATFREILLRSSRVIASRGKGQGRAKEDEERNVAIDASFVLVIVRLHVAT